MTRGLSKSNSELFEEAVPKSPPSSIRAQFKRQMLEKEVLDCVNAKKAQKELLIAKDQREKLYG